MHKLWPHAPATARLGTAHVVASRYCTRSCRSEICHSVRLLCKAGCPRTQVEVYANAAGFWVVKVALASVESAAGLAAYMATLLRRHAALHGVRLAKVPQHWGERIGDGCAYYARACFAAVPRLQMRLHMRAALHTRLHWRTA